MMRRVEVLEVRTLSNVPEFDASRDFSGIANLKMDKKGRHFLTLTEFAKFLEVCNEEIAQTVLRLSRDVRETLEGVDEDLGNFYKKLDDPAFLIDKVEHDLFAELENLKGKFRDRSNIIMSFGDDLEGTEIHRANVTGVELKRLVDNLVSISHELPDEIEHVVEAEAHELNIEIVSNKKAHANRAADMRIAHFKIEADGIQKWEDSRVKWRSLQHNRALNEFTTHITSEEFTDPDDRQKFMARTRNAQDDRRGLVQTELNKLKAMSAENIRSEDVTAIQASLVELKESESCAITDCYEGLTYLKDSLKQSAADR
jgi:hypothetical protein